MGNAITKSEAEEEDFEKLMRETNFTKEEIDSWSKIFKREFPSGKMTRSSAQAVIGKEFPNLNSRAFCTYLFNAFDLDRDGEVDFREFLISQSIVSNGSAVEKIRWIFRMYDIDGDKYIQRSELRIILKAIFRGMNIPDASLKASLAAREVFKENDLDGDGTLSEYEFIQYMLTKGSAMFGAPVDAS